MVNVIAARATLAAAFGEAADKEINSPVHFATRGEPDNAYRATRRRATGYRRSGYRLPCSRQQGFTLLELLVVLAILALIAGFAAPQVFKFLGGAKTDAAKSEIKNLSNVIGVYRLDVGKPPPNLQALITKPADAKKWNGPYLEKRNIPKDPWGNDYVYRVPGEYGAFDLIALGADGVEGGDGENQDINNWD